MSHDYTKHFDDLKEYIAAFGDCDISYAMEEVEIIQRGVHQMIESSKLKNEIIELLLKLHNMRIKNDERGTTNEGTGGGEQATSDFVVSHRGDGGVPNDAS